MDLIMRDIIYPTETFDEFNERYKSTQHSSCKKQDYTCLPKFRIYPDKVEFTAISREQIFTIVNANSHPVKIDRVTSTPGYELEFELPDYVRANESIEVRVTALGDAADPGHLIIFLDQERGLFAAELTTIPF